MMKFQKLTIFLAVSLLFGLTLHAQKEEVKQLIKQRVEAGIDSKTVSVNGRVLFSQNVLPGFYTNRDFSPAWDDENNANDLLVSLKYAYLEGLTPDDYHLKKIEELRNKKRSNEEDADLDMLQTDALLMYASHLILGKVNQSKIRPGWDMPVNKLPLNVDSLLTLSLKQNSIKEDLEALKPQNFMYKHLKTGLEHYKEIARKGGWPYIPGGVGLKKGMTEDRIITLRKYLYITGDLATLDETNNLFDEDVELAVKQFQFRHNLNKDGVIGKETLAVMNVPVEKRIDMIRVSLERARWVMQQLEDDYLVVNIAGFNIRRVTNEETVFYSRVIVGKHHHESPIFKGKMIYFELNPTWTLPYSIATKETLPKLKKNPNYLAEKHIEIMDRNGKILNPKTIDFNQYSRNNFPFILRQKAGPHNALGQVKFIFPNQYAVYLHDTPARSLFDREDRAFSHGCIRLDKKWELLMNLMNEPYVWNMDKINEILQSGKTTRVNLKKPIDIVILYWTAGADKQDRLYFNEDVYDRDADVLKALDSPVF
jgi:murein L,D-transpeptidase YcbB/YkuD